MHVGKFNMKTGDETPYEGSTHVTKEEVQKMIEENIQASTEHLNNQLNSLVGPVIAKLNELSVKVEQLVPKTNAKPKQDPKPE